MGHLVTDFYTIIKYKYIAMTISTSSSLHPTTVSWKESSPSPSLVELAGSFSSWSPLPMTRSDEGIWTAVVELECGRHEYKVIVDGDWRVDESVEKVNNGMGSWNNVLRVEEDKAEEVEETHAEEGRNEEISQTVKDEAQRMEDRNEGVNETVKEETDVEEERNKEVNETVKDETDVEEEKNEEVNETDVDQDITTESKEEERGETAPKPNFVMTRAVAIEQKMRDL